MSLKLNIAANYTSQIYVAVVGLALVPVYLDVMGAASYALVAFFALLQTWFQLLDLGLTATLTRETARFLGGGTDVRHLRQLLRALELIFWSVGAVVAVALAAAAPAIASRWLVGDQLPDEVVTTSLMLMAFTLAARWISGLYRGAVAGLERQVWLGVFNMAIVTARFVGVVPVLLFVDSSPVAFFWHQAAVSVVEIAVVASYVHSLLRLPDATPLDWSWKPLRTVLQFSATVAFTSTVGVLVSQIDKLVISKMLPLSQYGWFSAAVLAASAVTLSTLPITLALLPRLTRLQEQGDHAGLVLLYRQATQAVAAIAGAAALVLAALAQQVLWVWTGDAAFAAGYFPVLALYALGNALFALAAFPYYLQYAKGNLQMHLWGNLVFVVVLVPAIVITTLRFGALGAAAAWATTNALFFLLWTPLVHRRFLPGMHGSWLSRDVLLVLAVPVAASLLLWLTADWTTGRAAGGVLIALAGIALLGIALASCGLLRPQLTRMLTGTTPA